MATKKKSAAKKKASPKKAAAKKKPAATKAAAKKAASKPKKAATTAKAKTPARATPKVSHLRGTSVDDWAKKLTSWQADTLKIIRALVERHAPGATLVMKWGQPVWEQNGPFAWLRPAAKHVSFGFWRGAEMLDPDGRLEGEGDRMRHLKVMNADELEELDVESFVKQAVALNDSKGDPTKRK